MAATKLILKRSSIPGKRPNTSNLEAGELAVNTNANEPGLFFEVTDGQVVKVGPTAYLPERPTQFPARGEMWVDTDTKSLSIGNTSNQWQRVAAPFLGGTAALTVFVAPDFPEATDSLANDGQSVPFVTINRAVLEVTKKIIQDSNAGLDSGNNRYLIVLAPSRHCVINGPGSALADFSVNFDSPSTSVSQEALQQFNSVVDGGLILPRGVSVIGLDLKKCEVHPVHVPTYTHPGYPAPYQQVTGGPTFSNQPLSSIFKWTGNTYVSNFSALDKIQDRIVSKVRVADDGSAIFGTIRPHGLDYNDFVQVSYTNEALQAGATFANGSYYVNPISPTEFEVALQSWDITTTLAVQASTLPVSFFPPIDTGTAKLEVSNIFPYFIPLDGVSYELSNYSHHRLSVFRNCTLNELNEFYQKVQIAFPTFFGGAVNRYVASLPEYQIVADAQNLYPDNLASNSVDSSSPYLNQVNLRSDYGMTNVDANGDLVTGFKSVIVNSSTAISLQKDPCAYETYADQQQLWLPLSVKAQQQYPTDVAVWSVPTEFQLSILNETSLPNIRYYYETLTVPNGQSSGLTDINNDFRHFGFRIRGSGAYMQAQSVYTIGTAVGSWAMNGAIMNLTSSTSNFGSVSFQAEGFAGIGTLGGATQVGQGFLQSGIIRPLALTEQQVVSDSQKRILPLGSRVVHVGDDPTNADVTLIYLRQPFDPASILPFSLRPGTAVYLADSACTFVAYFVDNGEPTCILSESDTLINPYAPGGAILRVSKSSSSIPNTTLQEPDRLINTFPYIRRFIDPRSDTEKCYGFFIQSTNPSSQAPQLGSALRLNQTGKDLSTAIKRSYQFDPGQFGGVAQTFTVDAVETVQYNFSLNYNNKVADSAQSTAYAVYASLSDAAGPWIQSYPSGSVTVPYNTPEGSYITNNNRNYYAAENNLWVALYYKVNGPFNPENGPVKVSPNKPDSPFVDSAILDRQEPIRNAWQGYVPDPLYDYYITGVPAAYNADMTYLRGAVIPNREFAGEFFIDLDDGTPSMGIIFYNFIPPGSTTELDSTLTTPTKVVQSAIAMTTPFVANPSFGCPEVVQFNALKVSQLEHPKNGLSVVRVTNSTAAPGAVEYMRIIGLSSNSVTAVRNYYPSDGTAPVPAIWPAGTTITRCFSSSEPEPSVYDPDWAVTKATMIRYYQVMGFAPSLMAPLLTPKYAGERVLYNAALAISPINGYANLAAAWPVEFNLPSTVLANSHTWTYAGYLDYARGLPKYQTNELSRKLTADYQSYSTWGGRISSFGADDNGAMVISGQFREAFTQNLFTNSTDLFNLQDRVVYNSPQPIDYPASVLVFSVDDITPLFDGSATQFVLKRGGFDIPASQLSTTGAFVFLGGAAQLPGVAYTVQGSSIIFSEAPLAGTACDVRVVTSDDQNRTLEVVQFAPDAPFDGAASSFSLSPEYDSLENGNSFVFLGGVLQDPIGPPVQQDYSYTISSTSGTPVLSFIGAAPLAGTTLDVRGVLSGTLYRNASIPIVFMSSTDEISNQFNGSRTSFELKIDNLPIDTYKVSAETMFVNLGGVMQIPIANVGTGTTPINGLGIAYSVSLNPATQVTEITFAQPPTFGTTCNIRVLHQDEFITCPLPDLLLNQFLKAGPGVETLPDGELIGIDEGLING